MMNLREIKAMLKSEFGIKHLYELSQVDLIQNNEDLHQGIVKVELQVSYKRYVLGTFGIWDANLKVSKRKVKKYMAYFDKIETWLVDKQEVDVRAFHDQNYQYTREVKQVELLNVPCGTIEETQEEQQNEQKETKEVKEMELLKTIGNLINEMHIERTTNGLTPKWHELKALKEELNNKARSIIDDNYKDILKEETQEETQEETPYNYGKDSVDENCMNNQSSMLMAINNKDSQESICDFVPCGKDSVDTQSVSRSEYCEKLKPFTNYVQDMARHHRHDYNELIKTEYNTTKKALELFTVGELAFIPNTLDGKKEYLKGMLDTTKKDIKNLVLNNDEGDYEALELFYRLHAQLESTKGLLNELCGFKNEMILR